MHGALLRDNGVRIEGGSPERDGGGGEEEEQVWGNSMSLDLCLQDPING